MKKLDLEMRRTDELLYQMIPKTVADKLRRGESHGDICQASSMQSVSLSTYMTSSMGIRTWEFGSSKS